MSAERRRPRRRTASLPAALDRRFEAVVFEWEGTAVADGARDAARVGEAVAELCALGMHVGIVSAADAEAVDRGLAARPHGPGRLYLCGRLGADVFHVDGGGPHQLARRVATADEKAALDAAADATRSALAERGLAPELVAARDGRRAVDLLPGPELQRPATARSGELLAAVNGRLRAAGLRGLSEAIAVAEEAARSTGLADARVSSDGRHLEIALTDKSDAARTLLTELGRRGVGAGLVLVVGDELGPRGLPGADPGLLVPEAARATVVSVGAEARGMPADVVVLGGGPPRFLALLEDQLERRRRGDVPGVDGDPEWTISVDGLDPRLERVHESLLTLADGRIGTRGALLLEHAAAEPAVVAAGCYAGTGPETDLVRGPQWASLGKPLPEDGVPRRRLDLRTGTLHEDGPVTGFRFSSLARPGSVALRAQGAAGLLPRSGRRVRGAPPLAAALADTRRGPRLERLAAYAGSEDAAAAALGAAEAAGFERLLAEHRESWARRWEAADVVIEGDPELQRAVRFALFHLMASVGDEREAAVGARGLSGSGYRGHVFWDSDVFVLPFLAATHPASARAMLEYRIRRLPDAREAARRLGLAGARFPWEGADSGFDVTPTHAHLPTGEIARIRTGEAEEHIVADVAWAASCYLDWTGDEAFAAGPGRELLLDTARYWASRIRLDGRGRGHLLGVIGPDEYHEPVDDNAFTNVMARWNLRRAAAVHDDEDERGRWLALADALVDGYDRMSGLYEEFAGFFDLEPLVIADVAPRRPIAADLLLGSERTRAAQVVKQADVLMLHLLVPGEIAPDSLLPNLDYYEPRTAHGSSLSPAVHAALLARAGRFRDALAWLRVAARMDLDDLTGTTAGGLHMATMGGVWQALVHGFAGVRPRGDALVVDPRLPPEWRALELALCFRGRLLRLRIDRSGVSLDGAGFELVTHDHIWEVVLA